MKDEQRERLIELLNGALKDEFDHVPLSSAINIAEKLLANVAPRSEVERLEKLLDDKCDRCIERERADTVRKMQERLKEKAKIVNIKSFSNLWTSGVTLTDIDQTAKEMLEGKND